VPARLGNVKVLAALTLRFAQSGWGGTHPRASYVTPARLCSLGLTHPYALPSARPIESLVWIPSWALTSVARMRSRGGVIFPGLYCTPRYSPALCPFVLLWSSLRRAP